MTIASTSAPVRAAPPAARRAPVLWIKSRAVDLALLVATPLWLIPLIIARPGAPRVQELILYMGAFGALGHHLPGMLRAYGDAALFRRFRVRFLVAPVFLAAVCVYFSVSGLLGVLLITFLWTTWHTLMQTYGFARIYDAKVGSTSKWTSRLDHALCLAWIGAPVFWSQSRFSSVLELYYRCGGPLIPDGALQIFRTGWLAAAIAISVLWIAHTAWVAREGAWPSPVKVTLFAVSFAFWWFCMARVDHMVVGVALFDVFHDVQYLTLVWLFNRQRADKDAGAGGFTRFLFRRSGGLIGLYVGLVIGYGSLGYFTRGVDNVKFEQVLLGLLTASALLHFYFDGFIWKVREAEVRRTLGMEAGATQASSAVTMPGWLRHSLKWAVLFVGPAVLLAAWQGGRGVPERTWRESLLNAFPGSAEAHTNLGVMLADAGDPQHAVELYHEALALKPTHPESHYNLGVALRKLGERETAEQELRAALELNPKYALAHEQLANLLLERGELAEAEQHYSRAIELDPKKAEPHANLGVERVRQGDLAGALVEFERALVLDPGHAGALNNLAVIRATSQDPALRDTKRAVELAERLVHASKDPDRQALETLAAAYASVQRFADAADAERRALEKARATNDDALVARMQARLAEYEQSASAR